MGRDPLDHEPGIILNEDDDDLLKVLENAWQMPFTTRSDFARENAEMIAIALHHRFLTTATEASYTPEAFGREYRLTPKGLDALWHRKG